MALFNSHFGKNKVQEILKRKATVYFVGIGGVSMSALAALLNDEGHRVSGCDAVASPVIENLRARGIRVSVPSGESLPENTDLVVYTLAVNGEEKVLVDAAARGIPTVSRAELFGAVQERYRERIAVAGSHGKSTVTAMLAKVFAAAGKRPTVLSGAPLAQSGLAYLGGDRDYLIAEACEYRDSFLSFSPTVTVVLNIEADHPDYFHSDGQLRRSFSDFMRLPSVKMRISETSVGEGFLFGLDCGADIYAADISYDGQGFPSFVPVFCKRRLPRIRLSVPGEHNVKNALASIAVGLLLELPEKTVLSALEAFHGAPSRMEYKGIFCGAAVYEDYAHHPTEIAATICAARRMTTGRIVTVFQSHTYSRTYAFYDRFITTLQMSDLLFIADIYPARESDTLGMSGEKMAQDAGGTYVPSEKAALALLQKTLQPGDLLLVMGAGNFRRIVDEMKLTDTGTDKK